MAGWGPSRILAPLSLLAALVAIVVVVAVSPHHHAHAASAGAARVGHTRHHRRRPPPHVYAVRPGDTLTMIATRAGISVDALEQLNPNVDPQALQTGQRLVLTR